MVTVQQSMASMPVMLLYNGPLLQAVIKGLTW